MSANHEKVEALFHEALKFKPAERPAFLAGACGSDAELRRQLEVLLQAEAEAGGFLPETPEPMAPTVVPITEKAGDQIGRYKLLQKLGEGGCGVVYMAQQEEPVRRKVALKVIKLGMDTREVVARFEAERQALALMEHPNIARVIDGGATDTGRPYFVMELVPGIPLTDYCEQNRLTTSERLDLFLKVCHAVQHAHQKGIIHRDLKPSNILVTLHDGVPVPKVIDFGIAKATDRLTDKTLFTELGAIMGTPAYMSPEQAELSGLDIDTRTDIYSLGVLLYQLLTGKPPFNPKELLAAGIDEMRRTIREVEPPKPSTRLTQELAKVGKWESEKVGKVTSPAAESHSPTFPPAHFRPSPHRDPRELQRLIPALRGDLDWIVMKCLEKDRTRRYETANGLSMDLQRHLTNEPILARPPSTTYRLQKMVRRNKLAFAFAAILTCVLLGAVVVSRWQVVRAEKERRAAVAARKEAEQARERAKEMMIFLQNDILGQAGADHQAKAGHVPDPNLTMKQALDRASKRVGDRFRDRPLNEAVIRQTIGGAYLDLADYEAAIPHLERAAELWTRYRDSDHSDRLLAVNNLAVAYSSAGKRDKALSLFEEIAAKRQARLGPDHHDTLFSQVNLAVEYEKAGQRERATRILKELLPRAKAKLGRDHPQVILAMDRLAGLYRDAGQVQNAVELFEECLSLRPDREDPRHPDTLGSMHELAKAYDAARQWGKALPLFERTWAKRKALLGTTHPHTLDTLHSLGESYRASGDAANSLKCFEEEYRLRRSMPGALNQQTLLVMNDLGVEYGRLKQFDKALPLMEEIHSTLRERLGAADTQTLTTAVSLGRIQSSMGLPEKARPLLEEALAAARGKVSLTNSTMQDLMNTLGTTYQALGQFDSALALFKEVLDTRRNIFGPDHEKSLSALKRLADGYDAAGRFDEAVPRYEEHLTRCKAKLGPEHHDTLQAMRTLSLFLDDSGQSDKAEPLAREVIRIRQARGETNDAVEIANDLAVLGTVLLRQQRYGEAESACRRCVAIREKNMPPDSWELANARSLLGGALGGQKKFAEAEPLLLNGQNSMTKLLTKLGLRQKLRFKETLQRLVRLYEEWPKPDQAAEWKQKLAEFEKANLAIPNPPPAAGGKP